MTCKMEWSETHFAWNCSVHHSEGDETGCLEGARAQLTTMRAALEAAPTYMSDYLDCYIDWYDNIRVAALTGTATPKPAANVAALIEIIKSLMFDYGGAMSGDEIRLMAVAVGGSSDTVKPVMELSHRVDAAHAKARAALAQFEAGKAGEE